MEFDPELSSFSSRINMFYLLILWCSLSQADGLSRRKRVTKQESSGG